MRRYKNPRRLWERPLKCGAYGQKDLNLAGKTYDFPQEMFRLPRRHVDNEGLAVAISLVDLFHCPVDVASVRHAVNIGLDRVTVQRDRRQELLQALQACSTTPYRLTP